MLALGPIVLLSVRRILPTMPKASYFALGAMLSAYIFTIAEGFWLPDVFNTLEHISYAIAGVSFAVTVVQFNKIVMPPEERTR
jgi:hypothetical protein